MKKWTPDAIGVWLNDLLKDGGQKPDIIKLRAKAAGITRGELSEARYALGIKVRATIKINGRGVSGWLWELPKDRKENTNGMEIHKTSPDRGRG